MTPALPRRVRLTEVGPRDGLQNEPRVVPTEAKAAFVRALVAAGHRDVEVTSFVRRDVVPQLADAEALLELLGPPPAGVTYGALVPNERGLERALETPVGKVAFFTAASETFNRRNVNSSVADSMARFARMAPPAHAAGRAVRGYLSTAFTCPYEGPVPVDRAVALVLRLLELGCDEVSIGDTIGAATPGDVGRLMDRLLPEAPVERLVLHLHDTRGMGAANVLEGLRHGVAAYDASAGGLGGCPFAPGASGNLATEDVVFLLDGFGIEHGVDLAAQREAARLVGTHVGHELPGRVFRAPPCPGGPPGEA